MIKYYYNLLIDKTEDMSSMYIIALVFILFGGFGAILLAIDQSISSTKSTNFINKTTISQNADLKKELKEIKKNVIH